MNEMVESLRAELERVTTERDGALMLLQHGKADAFRELEDQRDAVLRDKENMRISRNEARKCSEELRAKLDASEQEGKERIRELEQELEEVDGKRKDLADRNERALTTVNNKLKLIHCLESDLTSMTADRDQYRNLACQHEDDMLKMRSEISNHNEAMEYLTRRLNQTKNELESSQKQHETVQKAFDEFRAFAHGEKSALIEVINTMR